MSPFNSNDSSEQDIFWSDEEIEENDIKEQDDLNVDAICEQLKSKLSHAEQFNNILRQRIIMNNWWYIQSTANLEKEIKRQCKEIKFLRQVNQTSRHINHELTNLVRQNLTIILQDSTPNSRAGTTEENQEEDGTPVQGSQEPDQHERHDGQDHDTHAPEP